MFSGSRETLKSNALSTTSVEYLFRFLLAAIFVFGAIGKFADTVALQQMMLSTGIPGELIWLAAAVDLAIAASIITGYFWRIMLPLGALYCIVLGLIFHLKPESPDDMINLVKNLSIAGGMLLLSARSSNTI